MLLIVLQMSHHEHADHMHAGHVDMPTTSPHAGHSHLDTGDHNHGSAGGMDHMMKMWFHTGYEETILFESWRISSVGGLLGAMFGIFILALAYEGLKFYR